jgi:WNK lysine deficient protein kinase
MESFNHVQTGGDAGRVDDSLLEEVDEKIDLSRHVESGSQCTESDSNLNHLDLGIGDPPMVSKGRENGSVISAMTDMNSLDGPILPSMLGEEETASQRSVSELAESDGGDGTENDNNVIGIPKQVILPQEDGVIHFPNHYRVHSNDVPLDDGKSHNYPSPNGQSECFSSPEDETMKRGAGKQETFDTGGVEHDESESQRRSPDPSVNDTTATTAPSSLLPLPKDAASLKVDYSTTAGVDDGEAEDEYDDNNVCLDDYIQSPEVQNAIVERSPGGRYVRFLEKLGSGASKDVYRAYDTQEGIEVAWNVVNLSGVPKAERNRIVNEVRLLERLHHQNIISFHGSWVNRERQEVNFVTEILSSGTLKSFINKVQVIRWKIAKRWAFQILKGLEYLHAQDPPVIHRDLKCENIFINGTSGDLRIGDLGLSTVHRNGRVLSVLGTPEFMAPDMYEGNSYNEKVDVYAFGMCLLEIFTKEIPYSECSNPAQIYKKVSAGEPPEVLSRLQSRHAREFVLLCLGHRDENGSYVRPTVAELLQHPFLEKRANDDDEVVVDPPSRDRPLVDSSDPVPPNGTPIVRRRVSTHSSQTHHHHNSNESSLLVDVTPKQTRNAKATTTVSPQDDEEDGDRFEEMQESEITMRKVKVLMGRGQELKEDDDVPDSNRTGSVVGTPSSEDQSHRQVSPPSVLHDPPPVVQEEPSSSSFHYLVAAAVLENENLNIRPYEDDILKLVVTLPVDGQTQNVQFDFHLVEDEPVQVAKEMVKELGIPQGAVLEISETISGLARMARMKQDKYAARMQYSRKASAPPPISQGVQVSQVPQTLHPIGVAPSVQLETTPYAHDQQLSMASLPEVQYPQMAQAMNPLYSHPVVSQQVHQQPVQGLPSVLPAATNAQQLQGQDATRSSLPAYPQVNVVGVSDLMEYQQSSVQQLQQTVNQVGPANHYLQQPMQFQIPEAHHVPQDQASLTLPVEQGQFQKAEHPAIVPQQLLNGSQIDAHLRTSGVAPSGIEGIPSGTGRPPLQIRQKSAGSNNSSDSKEAPVVHHVPQALSSSLYPPSGTSLPQPQALSLGTNADPAATISVPSQANGSSTSGNASPLVHPSFQSVGPQHASAPSVNPVVQSYPPQHPVPALETVVLQESKSKSISNSIPEPPIEGTSAIGASQAPSSAYSNPAELSQSAENVTMNAEETEGDSDEEDDVDVADELRKLDEDFQKNLERAKKVFVNRMDNLQRSQIEREAQHLKTLEKHEKERAEFEKRLALEAEQQQRRIEQLQREWDKKRESIAIQKKKQKDSTSSSTGEPSVDASLGHLRTVSGTSSIFSLSPATSIHKHQDTISDSNPPDR